jgi:uncharacterized membrane protein
MLAAALSAGCAPDDTTAPARVIDPVRTTQVRTNAGLTTVNLGTLPGGGRSAAFAINQSGTITGFAYDAASSAHLVRWKRGGSIEDLGQIGGAATYGLGIDDAEEIVGAYGGHGYQDPFPYELVLPGERAFYWNGTAGFQVLPGTGPSRASGVQRINSNTRTRIVGCDGGRAAIWTDNGTGFKLSRPTLPSAWRSDSSCATAVNPRGLYIGVEGTPSGFIAGLDYFHSFASLQSSGFSLLPDQGANIYSAAYGQSETPRRIVGLWSNRAVLWPTPSSVLIPIASNPTVYDYSTAYGVNNLTQVAGGSGGDIGISAGAFFWTSDIGLLHLPSVATVGGHFLPPSTAFALNDLAEVVGVSENDAGGISATLWLPHDTALIITVKQLPGTTTHLPPKVSYIPKKFINDGILSRPGFDATLLDPHLITLGDGAGRVTRIALTATGAPMATIADVDGDGDLDLSVNFSKAQLIADGVLTPTSTQFEIGFMDVTGLPVKAHYPIWVQ